MSNKIVQSSISHVSMKLNQPLGLLLPSSHTCGKSQIQMFLTMCFFSVLAQIGVAGSYALWAVSGNFTIFVIARVIGGVSKGNISLSTAVVTDVLPTPRRGKGMVRIIQT